MGTTRAAVFRGVPGEIEVESFETPAPRGAEVLVEVLGCTLCGSDRHTFEGRRAVAVPTILGHETLGRIVEFGPSAPRHDLDGQALKPGDRVCWAIVAHCGRCSNCLRGLPQKCLAGVKYGHEALREGTELRGAGGLADHCLLADGTSLVRVPDELPPEVACPSSCATATVVAALEPEGDLSGRSVGVFGAGLLGLSACALARVRGASAVVCVEPSPARRTLAPRFGATLGIAPADLKDTVATLGDGQGLDVIVELSGAAEAFEAALPVLRTGGVLVLVGGVFPGRPVTLFMEQVIRGHLTLRGVHNYAPRHLASALRFLAGHHGDFPFASAVSGWLPLTEARRAFDLARDPATLRVGVGDRLPRPCGP